MTARVSRPTLTSSTMAYYGASGSWPSADDSNSHIQKSDLILFFSGIAGLLCSDLSHLVLAGLRLPGPVGYGYSPPSNCEGTQFSCFDSM